MGIYFVTGRPGGGKSFYSMKLMVEELQATDRPIVTNLAIKQECLAEYLQAKHGDTFDILNRIHMIDDDEITYFYCHRGRGVPTLKLDYDKRGKAERFDIQTAQSNGGVFYILDEVHLAFGARDWQNMGKACQYYSSQHRKLGDDVILITQAPKMVDTTFRNLAQNYTVLRNHALEKILFFKQPKVFTRQTFLDMPGPNQTPQEKSVFRLDLDVAECYDTSQGVGIHERGDADTKGDKRKGLHWGVGVVLFIVIIFVVAQIPGACGKFVAEKANAGTRKGTSIIMGKTNSVVGITNKSQNVQDAALLRNMLTGQVFTNNLPTNSVPVAEVRVSGSTASFATEKKYSTNTITGYYSKILPNDGWDFRVFLSNGAVLSLQSGQLVGIYSDHVTDDEGNLYKFDRGGIDINKLRLGPRQKDENSPGE